MAEIAVVIKIDEDTFKKYQESVDCEERAIIVHGKVLPKDYGRIGDLDKLIKRVTNLPKCPNGHSKMYDEAMIINIINNELSEEE